jgi:hypothetical protein
VAPGRVVRAPKSTWWWRGPGDRAPCRPTSAIRKVSPRRNRRLRDGAPVKWPCADVPGSRARISDAIRPRANHRRGRHPPAAHPHPRAGGRGDGPRRGGRRDGRRASGGAKRVMPPNPAIGKLSPGATASRACRPRVGISVKCPLGDPGGRGRLPPAAHPHQRAGGRGDGARRGVGMIPPARVRQGRTKTWAEGWHIPPRASRPCPGSGLPVGGVNVNGPHSTHDQPKPVN